MNLQEQLNQLVQPPQIIGLSAAVCTPKSLQNFSAGSASIAKTSPLQATDAFLIYSLTKTFIAAHVLLLVEEGKLCLEDSLYKWFPEIPQAGQITIQHLLSHTSGLPIYDDVKEYEDAVSQNPGSPWSFEAFLERTVKKGLIFQPGERFGYSNIGYMLLKAIIEKVASLPFSDAIQKRIFEPCNLKSTSVAYTSSDLKKLTPGYSLKFNTVLKDIRGIYHPGWVSHGVIISTPSDIAAFYFTLLEGNIVSPVSLEQMKAVMKVEAPGHHFQNPGYGLGLMINTDERLGTMYGHSGAGPGYAATAYYFEKFKMAVCILANTECGTELEKMLLKRLNFNL